MYRLFNDLLCELKSLEILRKKSKKKIQDGIKDYKINHRIVSGDIQQLHKDWPLKKETTFFRFLKNGLNT